jgi:hypothetical protein
MFAADRAEDSNTATHNKEYQVLVAESKPLDFVSFKFLQKIPKQ